MEKKLYYILLFLFVHVTNAQTHKLLFKTNYGNFKVVLYDFTPNHRDLILNAVNNKVYHKALFNRVIQNFVVQGGEHDDVIAEKEKSLPKTARYRLQPEFDLRAFHKIGALGAGRDDNDEKASFLNQIYFVVGKKITEADLDFIEQKRKFKFTAKQKDTYLQIGGLPRLDNDYTVFGEVYEGLDVLLKISQVKTNDKDAPFKNVVFKIKRIK